VQVRNALLASAGGALVGAAIALTLRRALPADLRREMLESAESFILASIEAADLVSDAIAAQRNGDATVALDAAERAALALEPKIIRLGLVFGPESEVKEKALASSMGLSVFIAHLRDKESTPEEAGFGFVQGADSLRSFKKAASAEIRRGQRAGGR
jgi:hypothetical protein